MQARITNILKDCAVAITDDGLTTVIIHKAAFDTAGVPFRKPAEYDPRISFDVKSTLNKNKRTGITTVIASAIRELE